ncbi:MAG: hypothetical protein WBC22_03885 [Sedimentisphaerales bacterium]
MFKKKHIQEYIPKLPTGDLIKRTRIVVIDDDKNTFPIDVLSRQGYSIDYWPDIDDLPKLERGFYDIIILDIVGIGHELDKENEGVAVLRHLKNINPSQIIVAYSGQSHESSRIPFFKLADQYVPKPTPAITWKEIIDDLITNKLTLIHYWSSLSSMLKNNGATNRQIKKIEYEFIKAAKGRKIQLKETVTHILGPIENIATILSIGTKIVAFFGVG